MTLQTNKITTNKSLLPYLSRVHSIMLLQDYMQKSVVQGLSLYYLFVSENLQYQQLKSVFLAVGKEECPKLSAMDLTHKLILVIAQFFAACRGRLKNIWWSSLLSRQPISSSMWPLARYQRIPGCFTADNKMPTPDPLGSRKGMAIRFEDQLQYTARGKKANTLG